MSHDHLRTPPSSPDKKVTLKRPISTAIQITPRKQSVSDVRRNYTHVVMPYDIARVLTSSSSSSSSSTPHYIPLSSNMCIAYELLTDEKVSLVRLPEGASKTRLENYFRGRLSELNRNNASPADIDIEEHMMCNGWAVWSASGARGTQPVNTKAKRLLGECNDHIDGKWYGRLLICRYEYDNADDTPSDCLCQIGASLDDFFHATSVIRTNNNNNNNGGSSDSHIDFSNVMNFDLDDIENAASNSLQEMN